MTPEATVVTVNADREVMLPVAILDALGVKPGHNIEFVDTGNGRVVLRGIATAEERAERVKKIDLSKLQAVHAQVKRNHGTIEDLDEVRKQMYIGSPLRD